MFEGSITTAEQLPIPFKRLTISPALKLANEICKGMSAAICDPNVQISHSVQFALLIAIILFLLIPIFAKPLANNSDLV